MTSLTKFFVENKNFFSNILAFILFIYQPLSDYLTNQEFNWKTFIVFLLGAIVSFTIGKYPTKLIPKNSNTEIQKEIDEKGFINYKDLK